MSTSHKEDRLEVKHFRQRMQELKPKSIKNVCKYHSDLYDKDYLIRSLLQVPKKYIYSRSSLKL